MKVIIAKDAGYCFGVRDAVDMAYDIAKEKGKVYMLGDIVHNEKVVSDLSNAGAHVVQSLDDIPEDSTVLFRAHGTKNDIWVIGLYAFYMVANKLSDPYYIKPLRKDLIRYKIPFLRKGRDYTYVSLNQSNLRKINSKFSAIKKYTPLMFCINDGPNVSDYKRDIVKRFLKEFYPNKSAFEK